MVRFFGRHQLVLNLGVAVEVVQDDFRAESHSVLGDAAEVDQRHLGQPSLELNESGSHIVLTLFGHVEFRVFAQVAERACPLQFLRQLEVELALQRLDLVLELLHDVRRHAGRSRPLEMSCDCNHYRKKRRRAQA